MSGTLFVVATPIGNLEDITVRALRVLREVSVIAAEDTRRTAHLLARHAITTPTTSLHEHNEAGKSGALIARLQQGDSIALVSDAGTPTVSDPGGFFIKAAALRGLFQHRFRVLAIEFGLGEEARKMLAQNLVAGIAVNAFSAQVPCSHVAVAIEHIDGVIVDALNDRAQLLVVQAIFFLRSALLSHIADEADNHRPRRCSDRPQHDIDRKFRAVFPQCEKVQAGAHLPRSGVGAEVLAMGGVALAKSLRHQLFNRHPGHLRAGVAEHFRGARIRFADYALGVGDEHGVRADGEVILNQDLRELGTLLAGRCRCFLLRGIRGPHARGSCSAR